MLLCWLWWRRGRRYRVRLQQHPQDTSKERNCGLAAAHEPPVSVVSQSHREARGWRGPGVDGSLTTLHLFPAIRTDLTRVELAGAGFTECLNMLLVGTEDNYTNLRRADDGRAVVIKNPMAKGVEVRGIGAAARHRAAGARK